MSKVGVPTQNPPQPPEGVVGRVLRSMNFFAILERAASLAKHHQAIISRHNEKTNFMLAHRQEQDAKQADREKTTRTTLFEIKQKLGKDGIVIGMMPSKPIPPTHTQEMTKQWLATMAQNTGLSLEQNMRLLEAKHFRVRQDEMSSQKAQEQVLASLISGQAAPVAPTVNISELLNQHQDMMIFLSKDSPEKVAMGICQNEQGIWFYDCNHFAVCFPKTEHVSTEMLKQQFIKFFEDFHHRFYQDHTLSFVISATPEMRKQEQRVAEPGAEKSQTLLTQATKHLAKSEQPKPETPKSDVSEPSPNHGPGKGKSR